MPSMDKGEEALADEKRGNAADRADMYRMGKAQEMRVRLRLLLPIAIDIH